MTRAMKDSGIEWIGQIPEDWEVVKLKYIAKIKNGSTPNGNKEAIFSSYEGIEWIKTDNLCSNNGISKSKLKITEQYISKSTIAHPNDILICCIGDIGKLGFTTKVVAYNQQINAITFDNRKIYWKYGMYYLISQKQQQEALSTGNVLRLLNINKQQQTLICIPLREEQERIASILDEKVERIDAIIADTKQSIEELKQYKQSLITETVTKGLDKNVPMKDSGIEWIGQIPEDWEVVKGKYIFNINPSPLKMEYLANRATYLPMECLKNGYFIPKEESTNKLYGKYTFFEEGDIGIAKVTPCFENGNLAIFENLKNNIGFGTSEIFILRIINNTYLKKYIFYSLQSTFFIEKGISTMTGTGGLKRIPRSFLENYNFTIPSLSEQNQIVEFLDKKTQQIDQLLKDKVVLIERYEEYKKSMIYEYVTGKKEI